MTRFSHLWVGIVDIVQADVSHHGGLEFQKLLICAKRLRHFRFSQLGTALETVVDALIVYVSL